MDNISISYKVYVKTNNSGVIIAIDSDAFITDTTGWIEIDSGSTDKYHHAHTQYLDNGLIDINGTFNYKLVDGIVTERTEQDKQDTLSIINAYKEINQLKANLSSTDYVVIKIAEGAATTEEYSTILEQRSTWRTRISELEQIINS